MPALVVVVILVLTAWETYGQHKDLESVDQGRAEVASQAVLTQVRYAEQRIHTEVERLTELTVGLRALAAVSTDGVTQAVDEYLESGTELDGAESLARRAAARPGSDRSLALDTLGRILSARGHCDEAEATFSEALKLTDLSPELRSDLERAQRENRQSCRSAP